MAKPARKLNAYEFNASNWNKRNKEYQSKLRTGSLFDLSSIYRDLRHISLYKELSFGEKNLLQQIEMLLVEEITLVQKGEEEGIIKYLRDLCGYEDSKGISKSVKIVKDKHDAKEI